MPYVDETNLQRMAYDIKGNIVNNLSTDNSTKFLSAAMGKKLNDEKQGAISDLETIRSGAALGATAIQPSTLTTETLLSDSWVGSEAPYTYTLSVTGVTSTSVVEILPALNITESELSALQSANIQDGGQSTGSITLKAFGKKPENDLPIRVIVRGDL